MPRMRFAAAAILIAAGVTQAEAKPFKCEALVIATASSSHVEGGRNLERHKGQVPPGLAKERAIEAWKTQISQYCPSHSNKWWRARLASVTCDAGAGHEMCVASAAPARKLSSVLFD